MQIKWLRKSSKNNMFIFGLHSTSDDRLSDPSKKHWLKHKKMKKASKSSRNKMFLFGLHSTSDDWPSDPSKNCWTKCKKRKRMHKSSKKMFIFGLCSISVYRISDPREKPWLKCKKIKKGSLIHPKLKCSFLDYIQLLMIGRAIWVKNGNGNSRKWKRCPKSLKNKMFIFGLHSTSAVRLTDLTKKHWAKWKKMKNAP